MTGALKDDREKTRLDLIPPDVLEALGRVLTYGAKKYTRDGESGAWNWARGTDWSRYYAAGQRHANAFWGGEDLDPESGLPHLACALCCFAISFVYWKRGIGKDDRPNLPLKVEPKRLDQLP